MTQPAERLRQGGLLAWAFLGIAGAVAVLGYLAWAVRVIWPPLLLALFIVVLLKPLVERLQSLGLPRVAAVALLYLAGLAVFAFLVFLAIPPIRGQVEQFQDDWPQLRERGEQWIEGVAGRLEDTPLEFSPDDFTEQLGRGLGAIGDQLGRLLQVGEVILNLVILVVTAPAVAFYLLVDLPRLRRVATSLTPPPLVDDGRLLAKRLDRVIGGFLRGQLVVATIVGILASIGLAIVGVPFWLVLGAIAGISDLIPIVGPILGTIPALLVALITADLLTALWVVVVMVIVQQIESQLVGPLVMRRTVQLHPAAVILGLLAGASLFGFLGVLLAAPAVAALKVLGGYFWRVQLLGEPFVDENSVAASGDDGETSGDKTADAPPGEGRPEPADHPEEPPQPPEEPPQPPEEPPPEPAPRPAGPG